MVVVDGMHAGQSRVDRMSRDAGVFPIYEMIH